MNNKSNRRVFLLATVTAAVAVLLGLGRPVQAQNFDFDKLQKAVEKYTVIIDMKLEVK